VALRSNNTFAEELQKLLGLVANMKVLPDADPEVISQIENLVISTLRAPHDAVAAAGMSQAGGPGAGAPVNMAPSQAGAGLPPGFSGGGMGMPMGSPDEFRRMLQVS
jgi:hypothetical protein